MVDAAVDGDRLTVRGTCLARFVIIWADIEIRGVGDSRGVLDARARRRVLLVNRGAAVRIHHLAVTGGVSRGDPWGLGGGISNHGTLTLVDTVVRGNRSAGGGGGIYNLGTLTVIDTVVRRNRTALAGGGIHNSGDLDLSGSVVRDNLAGNGGGIFTAGPAMISHSAVTDNTASILGGGITNHNSLTLRGSTSVTANTAGRDGGGIWNDEEYASTVMLLDDSWVTGNTPDDCYGTTAC